MSTFIRKYGGRTVNSFTVEGYNHLIQSFIDAGYSFRFFDEAFSLEKTVYLRHDIDFSLRYALPIAQEEKKLNVKSTFFIQIDSTLYNPFEFNNRQLINTIHELGHSICLHIDETKIKNKYTFDMYAAAFIAFFPFANVNVISRHCPCIDSAIPWMDKRIIDVYSKQFFLDIEYASDSRGEWKYGFPLERPFINDNKSIQLLTHPFWWFGSSNRKNKIENWLFEEEVYRIQSNKFIQKLCEID